MLHRCRMEFIYCIRPGLGLLPRVLVKRLGDPRMSVVDKVEIHLKASFLR